jgi:hypothetical protein
VRKAIVGVSLAGVVIAWLAIPPGMMPTIASDRPADPKDTRARHAALARAKVFVDMPAERTETTVDEIECRFLDTPASGTTAMNENSTAA